jgi:hypothetical protein
MTHELHKGFLPRDASNAWRITPGPLMGEPKDFLPVPYGFPDVPDREYRLNMRKYGWVIAFHDQLVLTNLHITEWLHTLCSNAHCINKQHIYGTPFDVIMG